MIVKFNQNAIKKLKSKVKINKKGVLTGILASTLFLTGCNKTVFDTKYGFDKALIMGDDTAIVLDVKQWKDYSGEQLQLVTDNNFILLTSSFDTNCFYGTSDNYSVNIVADSATSNEEVYHLTDSYDNSISVYNKDIIDTNWKFGKSITFNKNNALILPVGAWRDYDGEQLQVITPDGLSLILSSYNSKLVNDEFSSLSAFDFAKSYVGDDGKVIDHALDYVSNNNYNYNLFDFNYQYNKAIVFKDNTVVILPIAEWCDYEGEQLQLKIVNGPTILTAAYDTILVNDTVSSLKAIDVAKGLCSEKGKIFDLAENYTEASTFNKIILDLNYGFSNVVFSNDNSSSVLKVEKWSDYEGEQLQVKLDTGDVLLSSSMMLDFINGGTNNLNASKLSRLYIDDAGKNIDKSNNNIDNESYNRYILDVNQSFRYALKVTNGNVTIIPLKKWQDFYNSEEEDTNCEQIQLILPDDTVIVTTAYDTILVNNVSDIMDIAELFKGQNGVIADLREYVGDSNVTSWNISLFDTKHKFSYAILSNDSTSQVFPIKNWLDFREGEQLQLNFQDNSGMLTSFVNTTLVEPQTEGIEVILAQAFNGALENDKGLVKVYK